MLPGSLAVDLGLHRPLESLGAVAGYLGGRVERRLSPDRVSGAAPGLADRSGAVTGQVRSLRLAGEGLLRRHGAGVADQQAQLKRLAHAAIEAYAQIATVARASSPGTTDDEVFMADTFCRRAEHRASSWLRQLDTNDDDAMSHIATSVLEGGDTPTL